MASTPIVSRLEVNVGWKAWFKTFFIHPTVTAGAAENMAYVAAEKEYLQEVKQRKLAENEFKEKVAKLLGDISALLDTPHTRTQKNTIDDLNRTFDDKRDQVHEAWRVVHTIPDPELKAKLQALFIELEIDEYTLFIDVASEIEDPATLEALESVFASPRPLGHMVDGVDSVVGRMVEGKEALQEKIGAYHREVREKARLLAVPIIPARKPKEPSVRPYVHPTHILQGAFLKTFGFDGYESSSTELVDGRGKQHSYDNYNINSSKYPTVPFSLAIMTFLGFPTRLNGRAEHHVSETKANLGLREIIRNLFGGWNSLNNGLSKSAQTWHWWAHWKNYTFEGKRLWNIIFFPIKLVIFAVKLVTLPLKFALNVLKLVTEFLPEVILNYSGDWFGRASSSLLKLHYEHAPLLLKVIKGIGLALAFLITAPIHYAARLLVLVGTAATSPEKSARMAWNYGRALNSRFGYIFGFIGAAISIALTATLWAIAFPLVFAKALVLFPSLAPLVTSIAQWPIIAKTLAYINGAATLVAGTVPAAFSLAATAISTAFGVTVSAMTLAVATTLAIIVAPVASIASRVMDGLSNVWTKWPARSPLLIENRDKEEESVLRIAAQTVKSAAKSLVPSSRAAGHASSLYARLEDAESAESSAHSAAKHVEASPYYAQTPKDPAPGIYCEPPRESAIQAHEMF